MKADMHTLSPWLYLPMELKVRDLQARILLAAMAAERGFKVVIGHKLELQDKLREFPAGFFFMYGIMDNFVKTFEYCNACGHQIVAQDEEGLVVWKHGMYQKYRVSPEALQRARLVFAWGKNQKKLIEEKAPAYSGRILLTGCPRFDLLRQPYRRLMEADAAALKGAYGSFVLVNTNFGAVNHFNGKDYYYTWLKDVRYITTDQDSRFFKAYINFQERIYAHFIEMLPRLSAAFPDKHFIVRPHPSESRETWRQQVRGLPNVSVVHEGNVLPWILAADMLIHNGCTTGVEAYMLQRPAVAYRPFIDDRVETHLPNALSHEAATLDDLLAATAACTAGRAPARRPAGEAAAREYITALDGLFAAERILDALGEHPIKMEKKDSEREARIRALAEKDFSGTEKPRGAASGGARASVNYVEHKFPGLATGEVSACLLKLQQASGRFSEVTVKRIGASCYCLEHTTVRPRPRKSSDAFVAINCPVCDGNDFLTVFETTPDEFLNDYRKSYYNLSALGVTLQTKFFIKQCKRCSFVFVNPRLRADLYPVVYNEAKIGQHGVADHAFKAGDLQHLWNMHYKWGSAIDFLNCMAYFKERFKAGKNENHRQIRLLDYGCGMGHLLDICRVFAVDAVGVDIDRFRLEYCRHKGHTVYLPEELPADAVFDVVISENVIEHVDDLNAYFAYISRRLHAGGIFSCNGLTPGIIDAERTSKIFQLVMLFEHINYFTPETLSSLAARHGFKIITGTVDAIQKAADKGFHQNGHFKVDMIKVADSPYARPAPPATACPESAAPESMKARPVKKERIFADTGSQVFFGYYDVTPFSADESLLLALQAPLANTTPDPSSRVTTGFYDLRDASPVFHEIGTSTTWCWQMGCRLQWYPAAGTRTVLYNRLVNGRYGCVIQDIHTKAIIKEIQRPLYAVSRDGRWGLSLSFSRLQRLRPGYGYTTLPDDTAGDPVPATEGIWRVDMQSGEERRLFSLLDIARINPSPSMQGAEHYFNHILFNPDGTRFMFFHLWVDTAGARRSRLLTSDSAGDHICLLNDGENTSHYCWKSARELLATSTLPRKGLKYFLYEDLSSQRRIIGEGLLDEDGHPSFAPAADILVTDTYPDKQHYRSLLLYACGSGTKKILSRFYSPPELAGEVRCDLHPRLSPSGQYVCVDAVRNNKRYMHVQPLPDPAHSGPAASDAQAGHAGTKRFAGTKPLPARDITVVIRSVHERTEPFCRSLIARQAPDENIAVIHKTPFSEALREAFRIGAERNLTWTVCVDADVLLKPDALQTLIALGRQQDEQVFEIQGQIMDKFFGGPRDGGPHLYRTALLRQALNCIPTEGVDLRPENHTILAMAAQGHPYVQKKIVLGFHDFEQYYRDIFRKCYVQAHKHAQFAHAFLKYWRAMVQDDRDFEVALWGFAAGIASTRTIRVDVQKTPFHVYDYFKGDAWQEKGELDFARISLEALEQGIIHDVLSRKYDPVFPTAFFKDQAKKHAAASGARPAADRCAQIYQDIEGLINQGRNNDAITALGQLLQSQPDHARAHNDLGVLYYTAGNKAKALRHFQQAVHHDPGNRTFKSNFEGFCAAESMKIEKALRELARQPDNIELLRELGDLSSALGRLKEAETYYEKARKLAALAPH